MTPEQIDAAATALINLGTAVDTYGPGIALTVTVWAALWSGRRIHGRMQARHDRANAWWTQCHNPPAIDTKPGHNTDDLDTCLQILRATDTARKEKP